MSDSRYAALRHYIGHGWPLGRNASLFVINFIIAIALTAVLKAPEFSQSATYVMFLFFFSVGLWITEAIPPFAVGILIVGFEVFALGSEYFNHNPESVAKYYHTWSSPVIWLMLGGFFMAEGMKKTRLDLALFRFTLSLFGTRPNQMLMGVMLTTMGASMIMSNTATTAMMIAAVIPCITKLGKSDPMSKRLLIGIPASAAIGGMGTIIGSPPNAIAVGILNNSGMDIDFLTWMLYGAPLALGLTFLSWFVLIRYYPSKDDEIKLDFNVSKDPKPSAKRNRIIVAITIFLTMGLWLTNPLHGFHVAAVSGIPIILLTISGVVASNDVRGLPWDTLMLVAGGLALGVALNETGLAVYFVEHLAPEGLPMLVVLIMLAMITAVLSNIMSNTATATILIPIACIMLEGNELLVAPVIGLAASTALLFPVSTPPNAIAFSTGYLKQADFRLVGLLMALLGPLVIVGWMLIWT